MYAYLRGIYRGSAPQGDGAILVEAGGVGYEVLVPPIVEQEIAERYAEDQPLLLYVSPQAGRDQPWPVLFGFLRPRERAFWELLKSVPRVGGKGAARAMVVPVSSIAQAIQQGNKAFLDSLPGVTLEGAEKIIASLRKKIAPFLEGAEQVVPSGVASSRLDPEVRESAIALLVGMGVRRPDALRGIEQLVATREDVVTLQDVVTEYLRTFHAPRERNAS
jgi:Holliday junction resolvasome RuvABC DNA-binding subunit